MKKLFLSLAAACAALSLSAAEEVIFKSEFEKNKDLKGWFDITNSSKNGIPQNTQTKQATMASVVEDNGEVFLKCNKSIFGMTYPFSKAITVDDNLQSITMKIAVRGFPKNNSALCTFGMTSRIHPGTSPFISKENDSGIAVQGYMHNIQTANFIYFMKNGVSSKKYRSAKPFNLYPATFLRKWVNCTFTYDNTAKTLTFTCDDMQPLVFQNVDMNGTVLRSLYICTNDYSFNNIEVVCIRK